MSPSNRPVASRSEMMIGFDVAPVAPKPRLRAISSGSTESSQSLVPEATRDCSGVMIRSGWVCRHFTKLHFDSLPMRDRPGRDLVPRMQRIPFAPAGGFALLRERREDFVELRQRFEHHQLLLHFLRQSQSPGVPGGHLAELNATILLIALP